MGWVHAAALNPADWHILRGDPLVARLMGVGLTKPKAPVAGIDAAGVVEAVGANVRGCGRGMMIPDIRNDRPDTGRPSGRSYALTAAHEPPESPRPGFSAGSAWETRRRTPDHYAQ